MFKGIFMKRLFSLLGIFGLLGIPALSYGEWRQNSGWLWADPDERSCEGSNCYKGDCREMMCQYGCIEDPEGKGHCASSGQSGEVCYGGLGCQEGLVCSSLTDMGICTGACPEHSSTTESSWQIGETGCYCEPGYVLNETDDGCVEGCQSYKDCAKGYFCDMTGNITSCLEKPTAGTCREAKKKRIFDGYNFYTYGGVTSRGKYNTTGGMDWWSAMDFCAAIGEPTVSYKDYCTNSGGVDSAGACVGYRGIGDCPAFLIGSNSNDYWLSDILESNQCYAFDLTFGADLCAGNGTDKTKDYDNDSPRYALCGKKVGSCPDNSSATVREGAQIGTTGCYCNEGFIVNNEGTGCITASMQCEVYLNNATYANKCSTSVHSLPYEVKLNGNIWSFPGMGGYHLADAKVICYYSNGKSETFFDTYSGAGNFRTYNNTTVCTIPAGESLTRIYFYGSWGIYVYATNSNSMPAVFTFVPKNE